MVPRPGDGCADAAEVEPGADLLGRLVEGVVDFLPVDTADDVERRLGGHRCSFSGRALTDGQEVTAVRPRARPGRRAAGSQRPVSPCQPIAPLVRPFEGGLTGSPDAGRCSAKAAPSPPSRRHRPRFPAPGCPPRPAVPWAAGRGGIAHPPPQASPGAGCSRLGLRRPGEVLDMAAVPQAPVGPLSFTVPSRGAAQGRLPERPKGAVCKTVGYAFPGSNPGPATSQICSSRALLRR